MDPNLEARLQDFMSCIKDHDGILHLDRNDLAGDTWADRGVVTAQDCSDGSVIYILNEDDNGR